MQVIIVYLNFHNILGFCPVAVQLIYLTYTSVPFNYYVEDSNCILHGVAYDVIVENFIKTSPSLPSVRSWRKAFLAKELAWGMYQCTSSHVYGGEFGAQTNTKYFPFIIEWNQDNNIDTTTMKKTLNIHRESEFILISIDEFVSKKLNQIKVSFPAKGNNYEKLFKKMSNSLHSQHYIESYIDGVSTSRYHIFCGLTKDNSYLVGVSLVDFGA